MRCAPVALTTVVRVGEPPSRSEAHLEEMDICRKEKTKKARLAEEVAAKLEGR